MATKSKLLVRSHAVRESTSPPRENIIKSAENNHHHHHSSENGGSGVGGGSGNQSTIYEDQPKEYQHQVSDASENGTSSFEASRDGEGRDSRAENDNYGDNGSIEMYPEDSPTMLNKRMAAVKINGQKKIDQGQGQSQGQGGQKTKFKTMGSSSSMEGVSSGFISRGL